ncbi:MAG: UMP kinase [Chthoniobacterales bacterium]|nr:UMP kinase [Chthoniobacterales bacterium]
MTSSSASPKYRRIVLKISGEALRQPGSDDNISPLIVQRIAQEIGAIAQMGVQVAVVVGGGNIWRGLAASHRGMNRATADYMGMLATVINGMALMSTLEELGFSTRVQTALHINHVAEPFILRRALRHLDNGHIVIFVAGTGNPFFSTDTTAALRANEIGAEVILKATKVDAIYDCDPTKNPKAKKFEHLTFAEALRLRLQVMDSTAFSLCMDNAMPVIVFDMFEPNNIMKAVCGETIGTLVNNESKRVS